MNLEANNYEVSEVYKKNLVQASEKSRIDLTHHNYLDHWQIRKDRYEFDIRPYTENNTAPAFSISFSWDEELKKQLDLKVEDRGRINKLLHNKKGEYQGLNRDYAVWSSNLMLAKYLLNDPDNLHCLDITMWHTKHIDLSEDVVIDVPQSADAVVMTCDYMIDFQEMLLSYVEELNEDQWFSEEKIMEDLDLTNIQLVCVICYQPVALDQQCAILNCCSAVGHKDHLKMWLKKKNTCPNCGKHNAVLLEPKQIVD